MKIKWYGHACFRIEGDGTSIVTDPYTPETSGLDAVDEPADIVIRSSPDDDFHCNASMVPGRPQVLDAVDIAATAPIQVRGIEFEAYPTMESLKHKANASRNAMYRFEVGGVSVLHLGDLGNPFSSEHINNLHGRVDIMLALTGGPPTIALDDLDLGIREIGPAVVIPMHYQIPRLKGKFLGLADFTSRYPAKFVVTTGASQFLFRKDTLPDNLTVYVLSPAA